MVFTKSHHIAPRAAPGRRGVVTLVALAASAAAFFAVAGTAQAQDCVGGYRMLKDQIPVACGEDFGPSAFAPSAPVVEEPLYTGSINTEQPPDPALPDEVTRGDDVVLRPGVRRRIQLSRDAGERVDASDALLTEKLNDRERPGSSPGLFHRDALRSERSRKSSSARHARVTQKRSRSRCMQPSPQRRNQCILKRQIEPQMPRREGRPPG